MDEDMGIFLFRAVQELLNNIAKHAHAHKVEIAVFSKDKQTCVSVKEDGVGFEYAEPDPLITEDYRLGLFSTKERFFHFVGNLLVKSACGGGRLLP